MCATKEWTERMRRCYMFRALPLGKEDPGDGMDPVEVAGAEEGGSSEEEGPQQQQKKSGLLKD